MALVSCGYLPMPVPGLATGVGASSLIDAASEIAWSSWSVTRSGGGTITHVHYRTATVTTGATVDVRLETLDGSGNPSGTLWGTNTNGAQVIANADDNVLFRTALTAGATVALGDRLAVLVQNPAASFGNLNICRSPVTISNRGFPYPGGPLSTNKVDASGGNFALEYDDGYIEHPAYSLPGACTPSFFSISTATNPDEVGIHFTLPFACRVPGWWGAWTTVAALTYRVSLYAASSDTPLATCTMDSDETSATGARIFMAAWDDVATAPTLSAGTAYRVTFVPLTATAVSLYRIVAYNTAWFDTWGLPGAVETSQNRSSTTDPDAASWTETAGQRINIGIIVDQISDGAT